jgi:putative phosphonate catabolism associated alcohol dehydrogenase
MVRRLTVSRRRSREIPFSDCNRVRLRLTVKRLQIQRIEWKPTTTVTIWKTFFTFFHAETMKCATAQVFHGSNQPFELVRLDWTHELQRDEILVEISLSTICGSDLHTVDGRRPAPTPCILGHEGVGRVVQSNRSGFEVGDRVTWMLADHCGRCDACALWNLPQKCQRLFKYGHAALDDGCGLNGCYASYLLLRAGTYVVPVPRELPDELVVTANCALATVTNALSLVPDCCERVIIQGCGLLGVYACAWLKSQGVAEVFCTDRNARRLSLIEDFGGQPLQSTVPSQPVDLVVELAGTAEVIPWGIQALRPGGHYIWAGMVHPDTQFSMVGDAIVRNCVTIRGIHNYARIHLDEALKFLQNFHNRFPFEKLVSPSLRLAEIDRAFQLARQQEWHRVAVKP